MGPEKPILLSILVVVLTLVVSSRAADPECAGYPAGVITAFPHEYNCSLYYECRDGNKYLMECQPGLYFSVKTGSCDFPSVSGCINGDSQCALVDIDYLPIPGICDEYIECYHGNSYLMTCPPGLSFDSILKRCVEPDQSNCRAWTTPPWTTPSHICFGVRPNEVYLERVQGTCNEYWRCDGAVLSLQTCPYGFFFDDERKMCDFRDTVDCDDTTGTPNPSSIPTVGPITTPGLNDPRCFNTGGITYWSDPADCRKYIECYYGVSYEMSCEWGYYFSDELKRCVPPGQTACGGTLPPTRGPTTERPPDWDPECWWEGRLLPFPHDCTKFYECAGGEKVEMDCPYPLWFHFAIQECDYAYQAHCEWGQ